MIVELAASRCSWGAHDVEDGPHAADDPESFDISPDAPPRVNDDDYQPPFPLTAKLNKLR